MTGANAIRHHLTTEDSMTKKRPEFNSKGKSSPVSGNITISGKKGGATMFELKPWRRKEGETGAIDAPVLFRREFDDLIERFFDREPMISQGLFTRGFAPAIDVYETDNDIVVQAEIPGMEPNDLDVNLAGDVLTIKGEKKGEHEERGENFHRIERSYGSFSRSISLPCEVEQDRVDASYKNGVLHLTLPKSENCKKRAVKITVH